MLDLDRLVNEVLAEVVERGPTPAVRQAVSERLIPVGVSHRHIHISREDFTQLFGPGATLTKMKELSQPGQFAARETVTLVGPKGVIEGVRILGPLRRETQVEVSKTDAVRLGLNPPVRDSGDLMGTPGIAVAGPFGVVQLKQGVILANRHIHMTLEDARWFGVRDKDRVEVESSKDGRRLIFGDVLIRVSDSYRLDFHVDTDEANAALLANGDTVRIRKIVPRTAGTVAGLAHENPTPVRIATEGFFSLVTAREVEEAAKSGQPLYVADLAVITPLARDLIREKKIEVIRKGDTDVHR